MYFVIAALFLVFLLLQIVMSSKSTPSVFHSFPSPPNQRQITVYETVGELSAVPQDTAKLKVIKYSISFVIIVRTAFDIDHESKDIVK